MKKMQENHTREKKIAPGRSAKENASSTMQDKASHSTPPNEETISRLNAIAREYPFCVNFKQQNTFLL